MTGKDTDTAESPDIPRKVALYLAVNFSSLLRKQKRLRTLKEFGPAQYTEDMAIADLTSISVGTGSDKVQTSSISKIPERVAIMLESGYAEKMQERMNQEYEDLCRELQYISWQLDIIDAAMEERMTEQQRVVFRWFYRDRMSLRYIHEMLMPEISLFTVKSARDRALMQLEEEVKTRMGMEDEKVWLSQICKETEREDIDAIQGEGSGGRITNRGRRLSKQ